VTTFLCHLAPSSHVLLCLAQITQTQDISNLVSLITKTKLGLSTPWVIGVVAQAVVTVAIGTMPIPIDGNQLHQLEHTCPGDHGGSRSVGCHGVIGINADSNRGGDCECKEGHEGEGALVAVSP